MNKHAPRKLQRISKMRAPWITRGFLHKMHRRGLIKKEAISSNDHAIWKQTQHMMQLNTKKTAAFLITWKLANVTRVKHGMSSMS